MTVAVKRLCGSCVCAPCYCPRRCSSCEERTCFHARSFDVLILGYVSLRGRKHVGELAFRSPLCRISHVAKNQSHSVGRDSRVLQCRELVKYVEEKVIGD